MNHKQKLGYMALGAGILALGIIIGQVVTPNIEAQSNGVFDKIQCRQLEVVNKHGEIAIELVAGANPNVVGSARRGQISRVVLYDEQGKQGVSLECDNWYNQLIIAHKQFPEIWGLRAYSSKASTKHNGLSTAAQKRKGVIIDW